MKKVLGWIIGIIVILFLVISVFPKMMESSKLRREGYNNEEIGIIKHLKMVDDLTHTYMGKPKVKNSEWSHLTEVYDSDGSTVIGYYIESTAPGYSPRRYYFDLDKNQVEASNYGHFDEGEKKLQELYNSKNSVQ